MLDGRAGARGMVGRDGTAYDRISVCISVLPHVNLSYVCNNRTMCVHVCMYCNCRKRAYVFVHLDVRVRRRVGVTPIPLATLALRAER